MTKKLDVKKPGTNSVQALVDEVAGVKPATEKTVKRTPAKQKQQPVDSTSFFTKHEVVELKTAQINIRVRASLKQEFEDLCKEYGNSQSDFFEAMFKLAKHTLKKQ